MYKAMNVKEQLAKEYTENLIERVKGRHGDKGKDMRVVFKEESVQRSFEKGWDAAVDYLARLPLDKMLKYFNAVLKDVTIDEIIKENKDVLIRLKDKY